MAGHDHTKPKLFAACPKIPPFFSPLLLCRPTLLSNPLFHLNSVDPGTALRGTVETLKEDGWGRHTFLVPGIGYWIFIPLGIWLITIAAFKEVCPAFLEPVQIFCE